jgi:hypothetical protein
MDNKEYPPTRLSLPNSLATPEPMVLRPSDFEEPLQRKEPSLPGYWTLEEIAAELGLSPRRVGYDMAWFKLE